ncbi:MFS transporter [Brevibacterium aurantiacum]|uniref:MFS transporter n=1 Tax=Brevibacterium aurantiacum TaxID=273384 RepID=UPI00215010EB|nr:MFS transporter [Brevibacterium aurantiacum]
MSAGYATQTLITVAVCIPNMPVALSCLAIGGLLSPLFGGASNKAIASELSGDAYVVGRSLTSMANSFGQMFGLAIGGLSVSLLGINRSLIICACTYMACAIVTGAALRIGKADISNDRQSLLKGSLKNIRTIFSQPGMPLLFAMQWAPLGIFAGTEGLMVPFVVQQWEGSVSPGALMVALPIGMFVGQGTLGRLLTPRARQQLVCPLMCVMGAPLALFVIFGDLWVLWVALFVSGIGFAYSLGLQLPFAEGLGGRLAARGLHYSEQDL